MPLKKHFTLKTIFNMMCTISKLHNDNTKIIFSNFAFLRGTF